MAYDESLAGRIRQALQRQPAVREMKMMGGLCVMVNEKMCLGIRGDDLMVRIDPDIYEAVLRKTGARKMDFTHRPMKGFVFVGPEGTTTDKDLEYWVGLALEFNKKAKASKKRMK
ncbi:MAG: TfoX/Sxy family protein [Chloroflexi bacterium]|nr:TfoX/Sxy family protein [Chloroflexota bacterium]